MGEKDLVMLRIDALFEFGEGQVQGVFAIFGIPDGLPIVCGVRDLYGRLVGVLIPKSGQFGEFTGFAIMISHLLLGDQAEPTAKPALAWVVIEFFDAFGDLKKRFLDDILCIGGGESGLEGDTVNQFPIQIIKLGPATSVGVGLA